ncbi:poly(rC)-binding protein 3 isoform X2 [Folsomia candida]|uniref:poly(rC)-binding protein 3 isoform X2 n=1 Tax=Folsomia candida TaxID=158441 RepID=UPI000B8F682E|nr:poly(rC)-binding protein 3 isoform X2 [Folsomia candida]
MATPADDPNVTLTIRLIMQGKEVGSIIGKKGEIVKKFREESGARINISDGSSPERIVTITGSTSGIMKAFDLICRKLEEVYNMPKADNVPKPPITLRLIVPASQCGSLIGKGGSKIREIREVTGASIQVASEMLPNSTERAVTISGMSDAITKCIYHICMIMLESPPKGGTIPYRPRPGPTGPGGMMMGQAGGGGGGYGMQGNYGINPAEQMGKMGGSPLAGLAALGLGGIGGPNTAPLAALAAIAGSQLRTGNNRQQQNQQTNHVQQEMTVPNELIGCVIGKGGTKIAEIRQISGAMIRISNSEELREGCSDRVITITGNPDSVALAQYLINMSVELQKANLDAQSKGEGGTSSNGSGGLGGNSSSNNSNNSGNLPPLAKLLSNPLFSSLSALGSLGSLSELLSSAANLPGMGGSGGGGGGGGGGHGSGGHHPVQTTGVHRRSHNNSFQPKIKSANSPPPKSKSDRNKFAPY